MWDVLMETSVQGHSCRRGKVRDIYSLGDKLLIVATDRVSAFDVVMKEGIPFKGVVLTKIISFWQGPLDGATFPNHLISTKLEDFPEPFSKMPELSGRTMLCWKADRVIPYECIVRGYLAGSAWQDYQATGCVCGKELKKGLRNCEKLPRPIFTPSTKAETGHDENVSFERMRDEIGAGTANTLRNWALALYTRAHNFALRRGVIIADTKFEFGVMQNHVMLIDEWLTPDSSRFWPADTYRPGIQPPSLDKQSLRDYLQALCNAGSWAKQPPPPALPEALVASIARKYLRIGELITGRTSQ